MTTSLYADINNLYVNIRRRFPDGRLDYGKYLEALTERYGDLSCKIAYGNQDPARVLRFFNLLKSLGFVVNFAEKSWLVETVIQVLTVSTAGQTVILGSSDPQYLPLVKRLKEYNVRPIIAACGICREMRNECEFMEITDAHLLVKNEVAAAAE